MARYEWQDTRYGRRYVRLNDDAPTPRRGQMAVEAPSPTIIARVETRPNAGDTAVSNDAEIVAPSVAAETAPATPTPKPASVRTTSKSKSGTTRRRKSNG